MTVTKMRGGIVKLLYLTVLLATIQYPLATAVLAHADYDRSVPAADEVVLQSPQQVQIWFTQELFRREGQNSLEVYGPDEQRVDLDDAAIDDDDRKLMTVSLQSDLANGLYTVRWGTLSADDGDDAEGEFQFTIQAEGPATEAGQATGRAQPTIPATPTSAAGNAVPPPLNTAQAKSTGPQSPTAAGDATSEGPETLPPQVDRGPWLPYLGSSALALLLLGALLLAGRRLRLGNILSNVISRSLSRKKK